MAHRAALQSYFDSDDFGLLNWARFSTAKEFLREIPSLEYPNGRPVGYFYYLALLHTAGFKFAPWAAALAAIGALNVALLWWMLRKLGFNRIETAAGCLVFGMNSALFDAWWRPAFIYDVLSATFALLAILAWMHRRWALSFLAFWLAMRSKEIAIALAAVLLWYEITLGERKWKRVLVFFVPAIVYGASGVWFSLHAPHSPYTLGIGGLRHTLVFYARSLFSIPLGGFALFLLLPLIRDPRLYFALGAMVAEIGIYLFLPERTLAVYWYLGATSAAIAIAAAATRFPRVVLAAVLLWCAWQYTLVQRQSRRMIAEAEDRRAYANAVRSAPASSVYAYADAPESLGYFGGEYVLRVFHNPTAVYRLDDSALPATKPLTLALWDAKTKRLEIAAFEADRNRFFERGEAAIGWPVDRDGFHPMANEIRVWMYRPANSPAFSVEACGDAGSELRVWFDGVPLAPFKFDREGCIANSAPVPSRDARMIAAKFVLDAGTVRVGAFGFHSSGDVP